MRENENNIVLICAVQFTWSEVIDSIGHIDRVTSHCSRWTRDVANAQIRLGNRVVDPEIQFVTTITVVLPNLDVVHSRIAGIRGELHSLGGRIRHRKADVSSASLLIATSTIRNH